MKFNILKNRHRAKPLRIALWWKKTILIRRVMFGTSCKYELISAEDQKDCNKLFGIGYFAFRKNPHQVDSARFGWYWNPDIQKIVIAAYCYVNGQRVIQDICQVNINWSYDFVIKVKDLSYQFSIYDSTLSKKVAETTIPRYHKKKLSFFLGIYFGGNRLSPQNMTVESRKIKPQNFHLEKLN